MAQLAVNKGWERVTSPHPSIINIEQRRQSQLLSAVLVVVIPVIVLGIFINAAGGVTPVFFALNVSLPFLLLFALWLNRRGNYWAAAVLAVGVTAFDVGDAAIVGSSIRWQFQWITIILLSTMLLPRRGSYILAAVALVQIIVVMLIFPGSQPVPVITTLQFFLIAGAVLAIFIRYRDGLERERQAELQLANDRLRESERSLEVRVAERTHDLQVARQLAETVSEVTKKMAQATDEFDLLRAIDVIKPDTCTLFHIHLDDQGQVKYVAGVAGFTSGQPDDPELLRTRIFTPAQVPVIIEALRTSNEPVYNSVNDLARTQSERDVVKARGVEMVVGIALQSAGQWQGMLTLGWKDENKVDAGMRALLSDLASPLADGVAARRAYLDVRTAKEETEQLYTLSRSVNASLTYVEILSALGSAFGPLDFNASLSIFRDYDPNTASQAISTVATLNAGTKTAAGLDLELNLNLKDLPVQDGLVVIEDIEAKADIAPADVQILKELNIRAMLSTNLVLGEKVIGAISFTAQAPREFSKLERNLIRSMSDLAVAAIERSRLYTEQLTVAQRLREADEIKSRFLASMSHELRTPLNAILNFTRFVSSGMLGEVNEKQSEALGKTLTSGRHLLSLINDVLDVTKIESNMLTLFIEDDVDLLDELGTIIATGESLLVDKPVKMVRDTDSTLPLMVCDRRRVHQILLNLVSNACKFTREGSVTVSAHRDGGKVVLGVKDTGPGIAADDQEMIFEPFRQARHGLSQSGGTGLGLAIARRLAEAHEGRLWVESTVGVGASFYVVLPLQSESLRTLIPTEAGV